MAVYDMSSLSTLVNAQKLGLGSEASLQRSRTPPCTCSPPTTPAHRAFAQDSSSYNCVAQFSLLRTFLIHYFCAASGEMIKKLGDSVL